MNWDTEETWNWLVNDSRHQRPFLQSIGNELRFMLHLNNFVFCINEQLENENRINPTNVNGNEIYIAFCELNGIETEGWK